MRRLEESFWLLLIQFVFWFLGGMWVLADGYTLLGFTAIGTSLLCLTLTGFFSGRMGVGE